MAIGCVDCPGCRPQELRPARMTHNSRPASETTAISFNPVHVPSHPGSSAAAVSSRMSATHRRDTQPELAIRRLLHAQGLRYRVAYPVPGQRRRTIDIAFTRARLAVFVDGCFWHVCPEHGTQPKANAAWWTVKFAANRSRDADTNRALSGQGWLVLRFWEHESATNCAAEIAQTLRALSSGPARC